MNFLLTTSSAEVDLYTICLETSPVGRILKIVGVLVTILKWAIPVALIIFGTIDLGKAVVEQDEKKVKAAYKALGRRALAAILVFIFPAVAIWLTNLFSGQTTVGTQPGIGECITLALGGDPGFDNTSTTAD